MNRFEIAENVADLINRAEDFRRRYDYGLRYRILDVYGRLSIFDWWTDYLSVTQLKQMKSFLDLAERLGYNGYACFKVGVKGCANGMWAFKQESTDGFSPDGEFIYHSFVSGRNDYDCQLADGTMGSDKLGRMMSLKEMKEMIGQ